MEEEIELTHQTLLRFLVQLSSWPLKATSPCRIFVANIIPLRFTYRTFFLPLGFTSIGVQSFCEWKERVRSGEDWRQLKHSSPRWSPHELVASSPSWAGEISSAQGMLHGVLSCLDLILLPGLHDGPFLCLRVKASFTPTRMVQPTLMGSKGFPLASASCFLKDQFVIDYEGEGKVANLSSLLLHSLLPSLLEPPFHSDVFTHQEASYGCLPLISRLLMVANKNSCLAVFRKLSIRSRIGRNFPTAASTEGIHTTPESST
eukprot:767357-Hanusia_phi.AAC.3